MPLVPGRAVLIPCLHDEPFAHLGIVRDAFHACRGFIFNSPPEAALADKLYGIGDRPAGVVGLGFDPAPPADPDAFRRRHGLEGPLLVYLGRKETGKNVPLLIQYALRYRAVRRADLTLVLAGDGPVTAPPGTAGSGTWATSTPPRKAAAYAAATVVCQPSVNESFSIVLMEAWLAGTPVLVHARCPVTTHHVFQAGGGLAFEDFYEFAEALDLLLEDRERRRPAGPPGPGLRRGESTAGRRSPRASTRPWSGSLPETLAFVVPWFGPDIAGGAEAECRATARALRDRGVPVEILTTCARDHASPWIDHHPDGVTEEDGFVVRRFKVRPRDPERYGRLQWRLDLGATADLVRGRGLRPRVGQLERSLRLPRRGSATDTGTRSSPTASGPPGRGPWWPPSARS